MNRTLSREFRRLALLLLLGSLWSPLSLAKQRVHTVYAGQRLSSIAKRYNISVDDLCRANDIDRRAPIRPGQKLVIPDKDGNTGSKSAASSTPSETTRSGEGTKARESAKPRSEKETQARQAGQPGEPSIHIVQKGHTLGAIGGRYAVTVSAICNANGIGRSSALTVGQKLVIPSKSDKDGSYARRLRLDGYLDESKRERRTAASPGEEHADQDTERGQKERASWAAYVKPAWRSGYIKIRRYGRSWAGYVVGPKDQVLGQASTKINFVMGTRDGGPQIHPRLIRLIAHVSDRFGGRELRIVSGYRTKSFVAASKHKEGRAIDFSIPGIPNEALRDYLRTLDDVGVGYYPNSSFIHLDVRGYNAYWIDYAGPGEAPRKSRHSKGTPSNEDDSAGGDDHDDHSGADAPDAPGEANEPSGNVDDQGGEDTLEPPPAGRATESREPTARQAAPPAAEADAANSEE